MEKYINMNDSFGNKHSTSSTKSFRTYEQSIQTLKEQLYNHQKALQTAENIVEQYQQQNQRLTAQLQDLRQSKLRIQQKYEVLQNLFIKLDKAKQKQLSKQVKRTQQKHQLQVENLNAKYEQRISSLNQRIFFLQLQIHKFQNKQRQYQNQLLKFEKYQKKQSQNICMQEANTQNLREEIIMSESKTAVKKRRQEIDDKSQDSLQKIYYVKTGNKPVSNNFIYQEKKSRNSIKSMKQARTTVKPQILIGQDLTKGQIFIKRDSIDRKKDQSRNSQYQDKSDINEQKQIRHSQFRMNTAEKQFTQKIHMIKNTQRPKNIGIYDNNLTYIKDYRDYKDRYQLNLSKF